jgi:phage shock protein PspC (stress-responsive transcriptional regulator)
MHAMSATVAPLASVTTTPAEPCVAGPALFGAVIASGIRRQPSIRLFCGVLPGFAASSTAASVLGEESNMLSNIVPFHSWEDFMKRLYRSSRDKKLTGLCAGLGEYFDLDPVLFRLLFILLAFFSGFGILAYLILCLMVPREETAGATTAQRLRRSASDRKIAGVCGGLGEFTDIDPVLFRAVFIVLAFVGGLGIILYLALWLAMPPEHAPAATAVPQ